MHQLNKNQKISLFFLLFFSLIFIAFWIVDLKHNLSEPFAKYKSSDDFAQSSQKNESETKIEQNLHLKDTDGDGLSDWDEINVYKTSPYLEDSDSDGYSDKEEIENNQDPNCPAGQNCSSEIVNQDAGFSDNKSSMTAILPNADNNTGQGGELENLEKNLNENVLDEKYQNILSGKTDAKTLRALLIENGIDKNILDKISDEELMKTYAETVSDELR